MDKESVCGSYGLQNGIGENNCFLNSAMQILWHLDQFRRPFRRIRQHLCLDTACVFCGIKMLFEQLQSPFDGLTGQTSYKTGTAAAVTSTAAVALLPSPDRLRIALVTAFQDQQGFRLGNMHDAAECFENICARLHYNLCGTPELCEAPTCLSHRTFGVHLSQTYSCFSCRSDSLPHIYQEFVHYFSVERLQEKALQLKQRGVQSFTGFFGKLVRRTNESVENQQHCTQCNSADLIVKKVLKSLPPVIVLGLAWPSRRADSRLIRDILSLIDANLCACHVFHAVDNSEPASSALHHLSGLIGYRSSHYVAFFYHPRQHLWLYFDDSEVQTVGKEWTTVARKCTKANIQPLLLFYSDNMLSESSITTTPPSSQISTMKSMRRHPPLPPKRTVSELVDWKSPTAQDQERVFYLRTKTDDSGGPSADSSNSSREILLPKNSTSTARHVDNTPSPAPSQMHQVQMLLRADDMLNSVAMKVSNGDLSGAVQMCRQAASLLEDDTECAANPYSSLYESLKQRQKECLYNLCVVNVSHSPPPSTLSTGSSAGLGDFNDLLSDNQSDFARELDWLDDGGESRSSCQSVEKIVNNTPLRTFQSSKRNSKPLPSDSGFLPDELRVWFLLRSQHQELRPGGPLLQPVDDPKPAAMLTSSAYSSRSRFVSAQAFCGSCGRYKSSVQNNHCQQCQTLFSHRFEYDFDKSQC